MEELRTLKTSLSTNRILVRIITPISTKLICRDTAAICSASCRLMVEEKRDMSKGGRRGLGMNVQLRMNVIGMVQKH